MAGSAKIKEIREQDDLALVIRIPDYQAAQRSGAVELSLGAGELNDLVGADIAAFRNLELGLDRKDGIVNYRRALYPRSSKVVLDKSDLDKSYLAPTQKQIRISFALAVAVIET